MATGQGGILSGLLLFAILFRLGLLQEPIYDGEYRRVNDLSLYACNASHISKFDYVLSGLKYHERKLNLMQIHLHEVKILQIHNVRPEFVKKYHGY
jgi:hypothetical protein